MAESAAEVSGDDPRAGGPRSREAILHGPLGRTLFDVAWPSVVMGLVINFAPLVTAFWMGRLVGTSGLAVTAVFRPVDHMIWTTLSAIPVGVTVLVSRSVGKNDGRAVSIIANGWYMLLTINLLIVVVGLALLDPISHALAGDLPIADKLRAYLVPWLLVQPIMGINCVLESAIDGTGWSRFGLKRTIVMIFVDAALHPLFISVLAFGVAGANVAYGVSLSIWITYTILAMYKHRSDLAFGEWRREAFQVARKLWGKIVVIGAPPQLARGIDFLAHIALVRVVVRDGETAIAGYGIGMLWLLMFGTMTYFVGSSAAVMIGQNVGGAKPDRARATLRLALSSALSISIVTMVLSTFARPVFSLMTDDPAVVTAAVSATAMLRFILPPLAVFQTLLSAYTAVGANRLASVCTIAGSVTSVILAYTLPTDGLTAATTALVITACGKALLLAALYRGSFSSQLETA